MYQASEIATFAAVSSEAATDATNAANANAANFAATFAARAAARAAATLNASTPRAASAASAAAAAARASNFDLWPVIQEDARRVVYKGNLQGLTLWPNFDDPFAFYWEAVKLRMPRIGGQASTDGATVETHGDWTFWIDWYEAHLAGDPFPASLLKDIVELPEDLWVNNPVELNRRVMEIYEAWKQSQATPSVDLLRAAIFQFEYDTVERMMLAVPFEEDWRELKDPEHLEALLKDAASFQKALDRLKRSLQYEGTSMQGAGTLRAYLEDIAQEFEQAGQVGKLLVGEIVELRRSLENLSRRESLRTELAHLCEPLDDILAKLTDMLRKHFASTLSRFSALRDVELEADADPSEVLNELRDMLSAMRSGVDGELPALIAKDADSLDLLLDDLDRLIRELSIAQSPQQVSSLQREINFAMAKVMASGALYLQQANEMRPTFNGKVRKADEVMNKATQIEKRAIKLGGWGKRIMEVIEKIGEGSA